MSSAPVFIGTIKDAAITLQNADGTAFKTLLTASGSGQRVKSLSISSDDTAAQVLQVSKTIGGVDYILGEISVPIGAGTDGSTSAVNGLSPSRLPCLQSDGLQRFIDLANGTTLKVKTKTAITAGKTVYLVAEYGDI